MRGSLLLLLLSGLLSLNTVWGLVVEEGSSGLESDGPVVVEGSLISPFFTSVDALELAFADELSRRSALSDLYSPSSNLGVTTEVSRSGCLSLSAFSVLSSLNGFSALSSGLGTLLSPIWAEAEFEVTLLVLTGMEEEATVDGGGELALDEG